MSNDEIRNPKNNQCKKKKKKKKNENASLSI